MTTSMYCLYVGFDYTYIDVNALAQGIKSFLASHVWSQAVAGARTYGTDSPAITMYVSLYLCIYAYIAFGISETTKQIVAVFNYHFDLTDLLADLVYLIPLAPLTRCLYQ